PVRSSLGCSVWSNVAAGRIAGDVAASSMNVVTVKARNTSLSNEESTDDKLDDTAAGSWKSTGLAESLLHAARPAVKRATIPARKNNRILPPAESLRRESKCACPWPESL